jgi:response regulator of citrate/malate metabolism
MINVLLLGERDQSDRLADVLLTNPTLRVVKAECALEARRILASFPNGFDLVIVDLFTPAVHGLEFLSDLRDYNSQAAVLVIADYDAQVVEAIRYAAAGYLMRPFTVNQFRKAFQNALTLNYRVGIEAVNTPQPVEPVYQTA